jgi:hypothetical protein
MSAPMVIPSLRDIADPFKRDSLPLWRRALCALGLHHGTRFVVYQTYTEGGRAMQVRMGVIRSCGHYLEEA